MDNQLGAQCFGFLADVFMYISVIGAVTVAVMLYRCYVAYRSIDVVIKRSKRL